MEGLLNDIAAQFERSGPFVRVTVIDAKGSTPREIGAAMMVSEENMAGTIGGGALEYDAIAHARNLLGKPAEQSWLRDEKGYPLGPQLGQCCGGHVRLLFERFGSDEIVYIESRLDADAALIARPIVSGAPMIVITDAQDGNAAQGPLPVQLTAQFERNNASDALLKIDEDAWFCELAAKKTLPIYLYGAGHVGREVVRVFDGMAVEIVWVDTNHSRFPDPLPEHVRRLVAAAPHETVAYAPDDAFHIVMSYSHPIDLEICHAVLKRRRFRYLGLIGSATKRARFEKRLKELGVNDIALSRLICPIGANGPKSKEPAVIAISLAAEILNLTEMPRTKPTEPINER